MKLREQLARSYTYYTAPKANYGKQRIGAEMPKNITLADITRAIYENKLRSRQHRDRTLIDVYTEARQEADRIYREL